MFPVYFRAVRCGSHLELAQAVEHTSSAPNHPKARQHPSIFGDLRMFAMRCICSHTAHWWASVLIQRIKCSPVISHSAEPGRFAVAMPTPLIDAASVVAKSLSEAA